MWKPPEGGTQNLNSYLPKINKMRRNFAKIY
jgi:hypothetical protein